VAHAIRQGDFARVLAEAVGRRAILRTPAFALRLALGEQASALLSSQRVTPRVLDEAGFSFRFPTIEHALDDLVDDEVTIDRTKDGYVLSASSRLKAPLDDVFAFFSSPSNLAALTPPSLAFEIVNMPEALEDGSTIDYKLRVAGVPLTWRTRIETWETGVRFVDSQERGPYRSWKHEHRFRRENGTTIVEDVVRYRPPLGALGGWVVKPMLRRIFAFRGDAIRLRFNA
jgi:ligand-binding SRPBCC domain-containing protein